MTSLLADARLLGARSVTRSRRNPASVSGEAAVASAAIEAYQAASDDAESETEDAAVGPCGGTPTDAPVQLLESPWTMEASWSPDCRHIAYIDGAALEVAEPDGTNDRVLFIGDASPALPAWSPDGSKIAFNGLTFDPFRSHIWTVNRDGSNPVQLTSGAVEDSNPSWSPDSRRLVFGRNNQSNHEWYIVVMDSDGRNPVDLTRKLGGGTEPAWSPDGSLIAFSSSGLKIMNPDGTNSKRLPPESNLRGALPINPKSKLSWSPDGTRLALSIHETREGSAIAGESNIAILELSTGKITQVTAMEGHEINPDWWRFAFARGVAR
ncbi:MAG: hypothetical protein OXB99_04125 [Acidimicrobiaceae bacterium]|nr:hypothetical protein [Acidimicrobiaceae bacterium]